MDVSVGLRRASMADAERVFAAWGCRAENFTYLSARPQRSVGDAEEYLRQALGDGSAPCFHIVQPDTGVIVGFIKARIDGHRALVGYVIDRAFWGGGVATAALREFLPILRQNPALHRIWATCAIDNVASARVLEKCGFVREGVLRRWIVYPSQGDFPHDNFSYCLEGGD